MRLVVRAAEVTGADALIDISGAHVPEYWDDHAGNNAADGYAAATVIDVTGGATSTANASLALAP